MESTRRALASLFAELEQRVEQRTAALSESNAALLAAYELAETSRQQVTRALDDLRG